eukprot:SAG31_NODE_1523_length_8012_cov_39.769240_6_plen_54_part_00
MKRPEHLSSTHSLKPAARSGNLCLHLFVFPLSALLREVRFSRPIGHLLLDLAR